MDRIARAVRISLDFGSLALFVYAWFYWNEGTGHVFLFWLMSLGVFPAARFASQLRERPKAHQLCLLLGLTIAAFGLIRGSLRSEPINETLLLGATLWLAGWGNLLYADTPPDASTSVRRLLVGIATIASGMLWLWLAL